MTKELPIDILTENPYRFRWEQVIDSPGGDGRKRVGFDGPLTPAADKQVADLVKYARKLEGEVERLNKENALLRGKVVAANADARPVNVPAPVAKKK